MRFITVWAILPFLVTSLASPVVEDGLNYPASSDTSSDTSFTPYPTTPQTGLPTESFSHFPTISLPPFSSASQSSFATSYSSIPNTELDPPVSARDVFFPQDYLSTGGLGNDGKLANALKLL
ncbi:hypothetical protein F5Y11DRAFT_351101 [Daldinia sp. FL1419]|nr:hypothetical protein F5Y11DRAFT_351101 [Daldinia sp. FL1419]